MPSTISGGPWTRLARCGKLCSAEIPLRRTLVRSFPYHPSVMQSEMEESVAERDEIAIDKPPAKVKDEDWAKKISIAREAREQGKELRRGKEPTFQTQSGILRQRQE